MHRVERAAEALLREYLDLFPCVAVIGPRQCGKTTLLETLPAIWKRFDLERAADHDAIARDPALFLRLEPGQLAIDEAQLLPALFPALRVEIDRQRTRKGRFVVTGSSSPDLVRGLSESLAGRVAIIELGPFSVREALGRSDLPLAERLAAGKLDPDELVAALRPRFALPDVRRYWWKGGYPEPFLARAPRFFAAWMDAYVRTYIERDISRLFPGLNRERFRTFIRMLASLSGTVINVSDVGRALGVSQPTARDYFEIAHGTFVWRTLPAFGGKTVRRLVRHPKGYLRDSGLLHHLLRIPDAHALLSHPVCGASWEGMVIENLLRQLAAAGVAHEASHYRTSAGAEVDLVLEGAFGVLPVEVKLTERVDERALRAIDDFAREHKSPLGLVVTNDERPRRLSEKLVAVPFAGL